MYFQRYSLAQFSKDQYLNLILGPTISWDKPIEICTSTSSADRHVGVTYVIVLSDTLIAST